MPLLIPCFDTNFMLQKRHFNSQHSLPSFSPKVLIQPSLLLAGTFLYPTIHFTFPRSAVIFFFNQTDSSVFFFVYFFFLKRNFHSGLFSSQLWRNHTASFPVYKQSCWLLIQTKPNQERVRPLCSS